MTDRLEDTIVAVATPPGRGGVAVIRISGPDALAVASRLGVGRLVPREATLTTLRDSAGGPIDRVLATWFAAPASYTGEDVVELSSHGGAFVPALIVDAACAAGARVADRGEFTRRAYLNGKLDLVQVEATLDLIDATSARHQRAAVAQLEGALSARAEALRAALLELQAAVGYDIDFPEEDDGPIPLERLVAGAGDVGERLAAVLADAPEAERLREGALTVIAGPPNAGKSSIFNDLLGSRRAIVTEVPGTTRDAIEADIAIDGFPFRLVDTAGVREEAEPIERIGIEVARGYVDRADILLVCVETGAPWPEGLETLARDAAAAGARVLRVRTKADLGPAAEPDTEEALAVSTRTGEGVPALKDALVGAVFAGLRERETPPLITRRRQRRAVERARDEVGAFTGALADGLPTEIAATHLQEAVLALEELVGVTDLDDVLDVIFGSFCVGK